ncbi:MAG: hypothetical protein WDN48_06255 [Pseudolabrys sp.]
MTEKVALFYAIDDAPKFGMVLAKRTELPMQSGQIFGVQIHPTKVRQRLQIGLSSY